ncbi:MAG: choice-of-anchor E domain-containing protein [Isosphaeraceae bacterium]|nr:choice-of-anchor E domain-containing protein [Isosphaeraceae bacterium]
MLATVLTATQTLTLGSTFTNFTGTPLSPSLTLFNPAAGTLVGVLVTETGTLTSQLKAENISTSSGTTITGQVQDSFSLSGLNVTLPGSGTKSTPSFTATAYDGITDYAGTSGVTFAPLVVTSSISPALMTDTASLAFYTASAGRTTLTTTMSAQAITTFSAPGGNLQTSVQTTATGTITVTYEYIPGATTVARYGVHNQRTSLVVTLGEQVSAADAQTVSNYKIIAAGRDRRFGTRDDVVIPINSAAYNATTNAVTLVPATNLNIHQPYELVIQFPSDTTPTVIPFNHSNLAGFNYHGGQFFAVVDGHVVR